MPANSPTRPKVIKIILSVEEHAALRRAAKLDRLPFAAWGRKVMMDEAERVERKHRALASKDEA